MAAFLERRNLAITMRCNRLVSIAAISGALLLFAGTYLHPMSADPNVPLAAFMEYAADQHWVSSHLMQFSGIALMVAARTCSLNGLTQPARSTSTTIETGSFSLLKYGTACLTPSSNTVKSAG